jgi:hypothetical protein
MRNFWGSIVMVVVLVGSRLPLAFSEFPDIAGIPADISVPKAEDGMAEGGRRIFVKPENVKPENQAAQIAYVLFLPKGWSPIRRWPVFVELPGNGGLKDANGDQCSGRPEDCNMGYGLTEGRDWIWVCLPFLNHNGSAVALQWWGDAPMHDPSATLRFWRAVLNDVEQRFMGDPNTVVLAGFSRGSIACNALGLHDDATAALWAAFLPCSHYDGVRSWPFPGSDPASAAQRLRRLGSRPQFICGEADQTELTRAHLRSTAVSEEYLTIMTTGFRNHSDRWSLRPCTARSRARAWLRSIPKND